MNSFTNQYFNYQNNLKSNQNIFYLFEFDESLEEEENYEEIDFELEDSFSTEDIFDRERFNAPSLESNFD